MPQVSVVIPAYNAMKYLPETLDSALAQTFKDFEVILVNDGSRDGIENWATQIADPRVKFITQQNRGTGAARNAGIRQAEGEYIAFLDADDLWHPTKLEKQVQVFNDRPEVGLVYTWVSTINEKGSFTGRIFTGEKEGSVWQSLFVSNFIVSGSTAIVRRDCLAILGGFDETVAIVEDWEMWLRIATRYSFALIREPLVYNRKHAGSSSTFWKKMEQNFPKVIEKAFQMAPAELSPARVASLKRQSYSHANLCLAWKVLQSKNKVFQQAIQFWQQAFLDYPRILFFRSYITLSIMLLLVSCFGIDRYERIWSAINALRRKLPQLWRLNL